MSAALQRECLEETGYTIKVGDFVSLYEEIYTSEIMQKNALIIHIKFYTFSGVLCKKI